MQKLLITKSIYVNAFGLMQSDKKKYLVQCND